MEPADKSVCDPCSAGALPPSESSDPLAGDPDAPLRTRSPAGAPVPGSPSPRRGRTSTPASTAARTRAKSPRTVSCTAARAAAAAAAAATLVGDGTACCSSCTRRRRSSTVNCRRLAPMSFFCTSSRLVRGLRLILSSRRKASPAAQGSNLRIPTGPSLLPRLGQTQTPGNRSVEEAKRWQRDHACEPVAL